MTSRQLVSSLFPHASRSDSARRLLSAAIRTRTRGRAHAGESACERVRERQGQPTVPRLTQGVISV